MALKAFLLNHWEHVPLCERRDDIPEALRAVFLLRVPNSTGVALIEDEDSAICAGPLGEQQIKRRDGTLHLIALRFGLLGWRNFNGPDGKPATFDPLDGDMCPMSNIEIISPRLRRELANEILRQMMLTEDDRKN